MSIKEKQQCYVIVRKKTKTFFLFKGLFTTWKVIKWIRVQVCGSNNAIFEIGALQGSSFGALVLTGIVRWSWRWGGENSLGATTSSFSLVKPLDTCVVTFWVKKRSGPGHLVRISEFWNAILQKKISSGVFEIKLQITLKDGVFAKLQEYFSQYSIKIQKLLEFFKYSKFLRERACLPKILGHLLQNLK